MTILLCYGAILVIAVVTVYVAGSVICHEALVLWRKALAFFASDRTVDEDDEPDDDPADWGRARERWMDREVGVW